MRKILISFALFLFMGCSTYRESMQGDWELTEIRGKMYEKYDDNGKVDIVLLSLNSDGSTLTITACDANGREMKATYIIKEGGILENTNDDRPNMYILDIDMNKIVLIDREMYEQGEKRLLVFKRKRD